MEASVLCFLEPGYDTHEPLMVALDHLLVAYIFNSRLPPLLIYYVDMFTPELVLLDFVLCLDTQRAHGDLPGGGRTTS
jgi:hypothetical protein